MVNGGKRKNKETNQSHMTAPRYSGVESLLLINGKAQASWRVQSSHEPEPCERGRTRPKEKEGNGRTKRVRLHQEELQREEHPNHWDGVGGMIAIYLTGRHRGMLEEPDSQLHFDLLNRYPAICPRV